MNCIFMGTPDFSVGCLEKLTSSKHNVLAVFSQPDKPVGRKQIIMPTPVKECAVKHSIPVFQPKTLKSEDVIKQIKDFNADIIIVVAYGKLLPKEILNSAKHGCINVHASLLPQYRGAAPIQYAVLNGDKQTGVTIMQMDEGLDTGDMLFVEKTDIGENETSQELFERLSIIGADALIKALDMIENNNITPTKQPQGDYVYAKMIDKSMSEIDWNKSAFQIHNQIRGLQTWPCAQTKFNSKTLKIHKSILCEDLGNLPGEVMSNKKRLVVSCGDGKCIEILELQLEGKKRMSAKDFLAGNKIELNSIIGG